MVASCIGSSSLFGGMFCVTDGGCTVGHDHKFTKHTYVSDLMLQNQGKVAFVDNTNPSALSAAFISALLSSP